MRNPKLRNKFSVEIETTNDQLVDAYSIIEEQIVSFDIGTENLGVPLISHVKSSVILWLGDDEDGALMHSLRKIQQAQDQFNITLNMLTYDDSIREQFTFKECRFSAMQHSILSYESSSDSISIDGTSPLTKGYSFGGTLKASTARDTVMKLVQVEFNHYGHKILTPAESDLLAN